MACDFLFMYRQTDDIPSDEPLAEDAWFFFQTRKGLGAQVDIQAEGRGLWGIVVLVNQPPVTTCCPPSRPRISPKPKLYNFHLPS